MVLGLATGAPDVARISEVALILRSGPISLCSSPMAIISAIRAFALATDMLSPRAVLRSATEESESIPTASRLSRMSSASVATSAKPEFFGKWLFLAFMAF